MKKILLSLTIVWTSISHTQSNENFDLIKTTSNEGTSEICLKENNSSENCLPVALMNHLDYQSLTIGEELFEVGHMDLVPLAQNALKIKQQEEDPIKYGLINYDPTLQGQAAILYLENQQLQDIVEDFKVLSVRRVASPLFYMSLMDKTDDEIKKTFEQYVDKEENVLRIPIYFNVRWVGAGISQGTLQVVAEMVLAFGETDEELSLTELFRPEVQRFSDSLTSSGLSRAIERNLRIMSYSTMSKDTADEKTMNLLQEVIAPYVGNYLYTIPFQRALGIMINQELEGTGASVIIK